MRGIGNESGFSLIELVVAMAIVATVVLGVVAGLRSSLQAIGVAQRNAEATRVLAEVWAEQEQEGITGAEMSGETDDGWTWQLTSTPLETQTALVWAELTVEWEDTGRRRHVRLNGLLPAPAEE